MNRDNVFLASALAAVGLGLLLLWPFMDAILWALFTAYFLHYFADWLNTYVENRALTTSLTIVLLIGFVSGIFYVILTSIEPAMQIVNQFSQILSGAVQLFVNVLDLPASFETNLNDIIQTLASQGQQWVRGRVFKAPAFLMHLLVYFVVAAFLLKDGKRIKHGLFDTISRMPEEYRYTAISLIKSIDELFRGVFIAYFIVAVSVGAIATVGFWILGLDFFWGWGLIIGIFAFFPVVSGPMVYGPLALLYIFIGEFWLGVIILVFGIVFINTLPEVFLRPYLAAHHTQEHPLLLFLGFIVGSVVLGLKGIILGPIILVVAKDMLQGVYFPEPEPS